jgi:hypothetical protein
MTFPIGGRRTLRCAPRAAAVAVMAAALLLAVGSCRLSPMSPARDSRPGGTGIPGLAPPAGDGSARPDERPAPGSLGEVPTLTHLRAEVRHGTLYLVGNLAAGGSRAQQDYSPYEPGGWCLQVFLDTDQAHTGYWRGYEYLLRGTEWDPRSCATVVRRITLEDGYPGGWGPASGEGTLRVSRGRLAIAIPLGALGDDDGTLDFALETYATVACPECPRGCSQVYAADYFGSCAAGGPPAPALGPIALTGWTERWGLRPHAGASAPGRGSPRTVTRPGGTSPSP